MSVKSLALASLAALLLLPSCGSTTKSQEITVEIAGSNDTAANATGSKAPLSQTYIFDEINITKSTGEDVKLLTEAQTIRVASRSQIVVTAPLDQYDKLTFNKTTIVFNSKVLTNTANSKDIATTVTPLTYVSTTPFTVESTSSVKVKVKVKWGKTVTVDDASGAETINAPEIAVTVE